TELFAGANPAVVAISTETTGRNAFGRTVTLPAAGSGFIISEDGYIVTNNHVIEDANSISVLMYNGTKYTAVLVGRDPASDLAVLKIDAKDLSYLTWGNSDALKVGEQVVAIGNPLGEFANSLTVGYISALDREINIDGNPRIMLQTDTAVNNGNSGGPLIDLKGRVIGIVSAKSSGMNVEGLGFAIPSNGAKGIVDLLIKDGYIKGRAVMGVQVGTTMDDNEKTSVYVDSVNSGSAAEKAGVEVGDIILSANGKEVSTVEGLKKIIGALSPGDKLSLKIRRGDEEKLLTVLLDEYKPADPATSAPSDDQLPHREYLPNDGSDMPFDPWSYYPPDMGEMFPKR
ncbi:MAG: trypsin-like peptidase domain-containing protein, partial [Oscillospiraceae bacterium]|nr:trypsin-like peptidase domain-containing protein [Oscillospiraceae bacterium]